MAKQPDLEELFAKRAEIDRALAEQMREVAVMFTDIVGSTEYFDRKGDIEGRALVQQHNDLLFPIVQRHRGKIVKTIGDAIMAVFDDPSDAVPCAAEMQRAVSEERWPDGMPLQIKIGLHAGKAIVERDGERVRDVYGDTVNTAARIASRASGREVLLSETLWSKVSAEKRAGLRARRKGALELKGKSEALPTVSLVWSDDLDVFEPTPVPTAVEGGRAPELFVLELGRGANGVRVSAMDGAADKGTVKAYEEVPISAPDLDALAKKFATWMHGGGAGSSYRDRVREHGEELFAKALSQRARLQVRGTDLQYLRLHLDDVLVQVPWELLHDGREFLALRFAMGRVVAARGATTTDPRLPGVTSDTHALVVSNASGDLPGAAAEGTAVADLLREGFAGEVRHVEGPVTKAAFLAALKGCRILHFAGHAQRGDAKVRGGFRLSDGVATPDEVANAVGARAPSLVFANSCHSSTGDGWSESFGLASSLLLRGTQHYVGPTWEIPDADALAFALRFYERALAGVPFGEAVRSARAFLAENHQQPLSFAGYVLYGEPRAAFPSHVARLSEAAVRARPAAVPPPNPVRGGARVPLAVPSTDELKQAEAKRAEGVRKKKTAKIARNLGIAIALAAGVAEVTGLNLSSVVGKSSTSASIAGAPGAEGTQVAMVVATPPPVDSKIVHSGPVRVSILPFKQVGTDAELGFLSEGLSEALVTDFGMHPDIKLIERVQIDLDIKELEFSQSKYVDPATRAAIGKIGGAEVVVIGSFQRAGKTVRATARFVNVETGEVLHAVKVEQPDTKLFDLQDALASEVKSAAAVLKGRLRS